MKAILDFLPVLIFFITFKVYDLYIATVSTMVAAVILLVIRKIQTKKWEKMLLISTIFLVLLGTLTLFLDNPLFIQYKLTVFYVALVLFFWISNKFFKKNWIEVLYSQAVKISSKTAAILLNGTIMFFLAMALVNIGLIKWLDLDTWVTVKTWGLLAMLILFTIWQIWIISNDATAKQFLEASEKSKSDKNSATKNLT